jgi:MFS family permease
MSQSVELVKLYGASLLMSFGQGMIIPTIPVIAGAFSISPGLAAQVVTAQGLGRVVGQLPGGVITDRWGSKIAMVLGVVLVAGGSFATAVTPFFSLFLLAQFFVGAGDSIWRLSREVSGLDLVHADQRGRMMSGFMGISSAGIALGPVAGGVITDLASFRAVFWLYGAIGLGTLAMSLGKTQDATAHRIAASLEFHWGKLSQVRPEYRATYLVLVFTTFSMMIYRTALQGLLPLLVVTQLGFSTTHVGTLFGLSGLFVLAMIVPAGIITDKIGRKVATVPSTALPGLAFLALPFVDSMLGLSILAAAIGAANGLSLGSVATTTYDVVPQASRGQLQALRRTVGEVGGTLGPLLGGLIVDAYSPATAFLFYAPFMLLAAALLAFVARETLVKPASRL